MKRRNVMTLVLALILAVGILSEASAATFADGYYIYVQDSPLFEKLPEEHYGPEAVVEYDEEHFAVFCDADQGYWGIGLKAECYPLSESDSYTFENPAVIILADAGYDNNRFETFDLIISIDRVTYASVPGSVLNGEADVLGVFGYSREMETIGLLSGWGCRAQKDENGTVVTDGGVWQVADEAAYDTAGLCTEAEISVTAVRKDGREIAPKHVGWTSWIVADLDMLQIEGGAVGGTREYEPHYFDEQLILCDGFVNQYNVQRGNVLTADSKECENDSELGHGEMTGLAEGELAKRYSSVALKQKDTTAHAVWRGCGSEEAPARTELLIKGSPKKPVEKSSYTVRYLEEGTGEQLAEPKTLADQHVGKTVTEDAIVIENYDLVSDASQSKTLVRDANENVITFYYKRALSDYEVQYLEEGTEKQLAEPKNVKDQPVGSSVSESAITIENYDLVGEASQSKTLVRDASENVIIFYYKRAVSDYEVQYLEEGTEKQLAEPKNVKDQPVGSSVSENAITIENYDLVGEASQSKTLERDASKNVITFYYIKKYTVTYVVNPDPIYGTPEGSTVPSDSNRYKAGETVNVKTQLTTAVDYAYNEKGEKVKGTWEFVTWDKDDFPIYENTTITGGWKFTPAPAKKYSYIIHYKLYEGSIANAATVHADTYGTVDALGDTVEVDAIEVKSLNAKYKNIKKYEIRHGFEHVSVTITHDNYEITIWYQPKSTGS